MLLKIRMKAIFVGIFCLHGCLDLDTRIENPKTLEIDLSSDQTTENQLDQESTDYSDPDAQSTDQLMDQSLNENRGHHG